jgi:hypothetical protein
MAITASVTTIQGIVLQNAYINLQLPTITKTKNIEGNNIFILSANPYIFADKAAYDAGKIPVEGIDLSCEIDLTKNVFEQGYSALKSNARFTNCADC